MSVNSLPRCEHVAFKVICSIKNKEFSSAGKHDLQVLLNHFLSCFRNQVRVLNDPKEKQVH